MTATGRGVAAHALAILADDVCNPDARRRAEAYVAAIAQPDLEAVFLALPILDGIVRHEITARARDSS
jgi:hypothetical protein